MVAPHHRPDDPLDARFSELDRRTDDRLASLAEAQPVPAGLEARVFAASVQHLPSPTVLQLPARPKSPTSTWIARVGVAAALGLVAAAAWWNGRAAPAPGPDRTAMGPSTAALASDMRDLDWHVGDEIAAMHGRVDWLLTSEDVRRTTDVVGELTRLFPEVVE